MCNCKSGKGIPNKVDDKWFVNHIYEQYKTNIGDKTIQYLTTEQREMIVGWYYTIYHNSKPVDYKIAYSELNKLFQYHNLI